jgi:apolipoprotein N-acyltransferase
MMIALTVLLLSAAFAPFKQFYLAWIGLVPMLLVVLAAPTKKKAFLWAWLCGVIFFLLNFAYLIRVTVPGWIALAVYLSLYWGLAGLLIRGTARFKRLTLVAIPCIWVACEWLRGTLLTGLPLNYIGHTQSPFLAMCQVADFAGAFGVTFCVLLLNGLVVLMIRGGRRALPAIILILGMIAVVIGYGAFRLHQEATTAGPRVMVVQPNHPMTRGVKSVTQVQSVEFHLNTTLEALKKTSGVDLVIWNETTMPPLNPEVRAEPGLGDAPFLKQVHQAISNLTKQANVALVTGGYYVGGWQGEIGHRRATDIRNSAYFYDRNGEQTARYDKVHLVPFGEFIPFKLSLPWLFQAFMWLGPHHEEYSISANEQMAMTVFDLHGANGATWRFATAICFEDLDAPLLASMMHAPDGGKRADMIINISNDGWFHWNEQAQHLQAATFRCIETRAPMARAATTGISGFIDSTGRVHDVLAQGASGTSIAELRPDARVPLYLRIGDAFAIACVVVTAWLIIVSVWKGRRAVEAK